MGSGGSGTGGDPGTGAIAAPVATPAIARLSQLQWANSVRDLLLLPNPGDLTLPTADAVVRLDNEADSLFINQSLHDDLQAAAERLAALVASDATAIARLLPAGAPTDATARATSFIQTFGRRAYRRPLTAVPNFPDATPDWTVSAWVRYAQSDIGSDLATIIGTEIPSTGGWEMQGPVNAETSKLEFSYSHPGPGYYTLICCEIQPDRWMHFTAVIDSQSLTMTLYLGGHAQIVEQVQGPILPGNHSLHIGIEQKPNQLAGPFQGAVDEIRIYDRALNAAEIARLDVGP